ncbi:hypothetical protein [Pseudoduganella namucuonensis]|nr:hypothetical protein [Pseudoduganella namucuonensis]
MTTLAWAASLALSPAVFAQELANGGDSRYLSRLVPFESSHAIVQRAQNDETALNARYSFRYSIISDESHHMPCRAATPDATDERDCSEWFLAYNGEFDFYAGTRPSGPVINRTSNPSGHFRWRDKEGSYVDVGIQHRSNGQVQDPSDPLVQERAAHAYAIGDHAYFDGMSRSSNYVSLEGGKRWRENYQLTASGKLYFAQDGDVSWGPLANSRSKLSDYDRLQFRARAKFWRADAGIEWTVGDKGLHTDSWNADISIVYGGLPFYLRYHHGPMRTLSNYTVPQSTIGFGLIFLPDPWARANRDTDTKARKQDSKNVQ